MIKVKTAEATKLQLDWGLAIATNAAPRMIDGQVFVLFARVNCADVFKRDTTPRDAVQWYKHDHPTVCMGLTDQINIMQQATDGSWRVAAFYEKGKKHKAHGKTLPEAVARCVIAMKLGDEFEVPDELALS